VQLELSLTGWLVARTAVYFEKIQVFKAGLCLKALALYNRIGLMFCFIGLQSVAMINRNSWGYSYLVVRGEILGLTKDELLRKHL